jgi:hypothetical protein
MADPSASQRWHFQGQPPCATRICSLAQRGRVLARGPLAPLPHLDGRPSTGHAPAAAARVQGALLHVQRWSCSSDVCTDALRALHCLPCAAEPPAGSSAAGGRWALGLNARPGAQRPTRISTSNVLGYERFRSLLLTPTLLEARADGGGSAVGLDRYEIAQTPAAQRVRGTRRAAPGGALRRAARCAGRPAAQRRCAERSAAPRWTWRLWSGTGSCSRSWLRILSACSAAVRQSTTGRGSRLACGRRRQRWPRRRPPRAGRAAAPPQTAGTPGAAQTP